MILVSRHRDSRGTQKYLGDVNIALSAGYPTSILGPPIKGSITNNLQYLLLPQNCVLAGDQPEEKDTPRYITDPLGILKKIIYGE